MKASPQPPIREIRAIRGHLSVRYGPTPHEQKGPRISLITRIVKASPTLPIRGIRAIRGHLPVRTAHAS